MNHDLGNSPIPPHAVHSLSTSHQERLIDDKGRGQFFRIGMEAVHQAKKGFRGKPTWGFGAATTRIINRISSPGNLQIGRIQLDPLKFSRSTLSSVGICRLLVSRRDWNLVGNPSISTAGPAFRHHHALAAHPLPINRFIR